MEIQVLMSTCNKNNIEDLNLEKKNIRERCIIVNQKSDKYKEEIIDTIEMYSYKEKGLSKSRNRLIEHATGDIGIITDDDISFFANYDKVLENTYRKYPQADVITFCTKKGENVIGPKKMKKHSLYSIMTIASFQISFRISSIKNYNIKMDELFGLGAKYKAGEENIFLYDCKKKGLNVIHIPVVINEHPDEATTGEKWDTDLIKTKGAFSYRVLGRLHFLFLIYFSVFKYKFYKKTVSISNFAKIYMTGVKEYKKK